MLGKIAYHFFMNDGGPLSYGIKVLDIPEQVIGDLKGYNAQVVTMTVGDEASGEIAQAAAVEVDGPADAASDADASDTAATKA